jgi:hypothetical protein
MSVIISSAQNKSTWSDGVMEYCRNSKSQFSNIKQITMTEIQNLKTPGHLKKVASQICFGHWILAFGIYLYFGACIL